MSHIAITTTQAPAAIGPYSQAIALGNAVYTSGMLPIDAEGNLKEGIVDQTHQIVKNLQAVLAEAGLSLADVVKTSVFMTNLEHFQQMNEVYSQYFSDHHPARTTVEVSKLPRDAKIEIELIAVKRN
ncbi:RidA family protein [Paenibacillus lautus]|jgi:2-iminobutanoate/2-iminopropanoate deaminase|uniref:RidA family protein n=1 Tax=Paenibacillus lautus TaxID=1401 RepID=A0A385TGL7_PAELA|nr:RidA family protein [Paenibacillus lautus]AYB42763.1 RidA family protein [Paenibacillus lautus]MBY0160619.1 RidA family protein [Cytobacillus firmus]MCI1776912.1 RidA family protein [Paenibacillus lautus]VTR41133.1 putative translation initiation inhibitor [Actinobacillus pleuropneumoniae]